MLGAYGGNVIGVEIIDVLDKGGWLFLEKTWFCCLWYWDGWFSCWCLYSFDLIGCWCGWTFSLHPRSYRTVEDISEMF